MARISAMPENYSESKFNQKVEAMGTLSMIHNTNLMLKELYLEYKNRGEIEKFFDHLKNSLDAS